MGIAMSSGIIRDFAGPYFVSEDNMAFGSPTKYWQLQPLLARGGQSGWDRAVTEASEEYKTRMVRISFIFYFSYYVGKFLSVCLCWVNI